MKNNYAVIMAGGVGSRFWPMSTPKRPKQFLDVLGIGKTLIQMTYNRLLRVVPKENVFILTNEKYADLVAEQLPDIQRNQILTEPERKNTAPCIAYAAGKIYSKNSDACMLVCPSDQLIVQEEKFVATIHKAVENATEDNSIVTIGIKPTRPDTGYGYIEFPESTSIEAGKVVDVVQFREKPEEKIAKDFLTRGNFYWNSGMFIWNASVVLDSLKKHQNTLYSIFMQDVSKYNTEEEQNYINNCFAKCEDISIDYAVMEKADNIKVVLSDFDWSDLGTWGSLDEHLQKDENSNSILGENVHVFDSKNCQVNVPNDKLVVLDGLEDYIVVESENKLLVLKKENDQAIKTYLEEIKKGSSSFFE